MANNNKSSRKSYLNDFQLNENNQYEYHGNVYKVEGVSKSTYVLLFLATILLCAFQIVSGCLPFSAMMNGVFVILPYLLGLGFTILFLYTYLLFFFKRNNLRDYNYKKTVERIKPYSIVVMAAIISTILGLILFYLTGNELDSLPLLITFITLQLCEFAFVFYAYKTLLSLKVTLIQKKEDVFITPNETKE